MIDSLFICLRCWTICFAFEELLWSPHSTVAAHYFFHLCVCLSLWWGHLTWCRCYCY